MSYFHLLPLSLLLSCVISNLICGTVVISSSWRLQRVSVSSLAASPPHSSPVSLPFQPQTLTSAPPVGLISPLLKGAGMWVYEGSLWGTIQPYHHREVLWEAEGCFWTSRFMEITDQSSDWQATDCMCLSGSWLMGADGFWLTWCPAGCMRADCMVSSPANAMQYCALIVLYFSPYETVICRLSKLFLSDMPVWESNHNSIWVI